MSLCLLCESKRSLDAYEALIYNKDLVDNEDTVYGGVSKGSWKAPHQERTLESKWPRAFAANDTLFVFCAARI